VPKIAYREQRFNSKARKTVEQAKLILEDLVSQGYTPTLRQLYYQFVRRNWLVNSEGEYKRLGRIVCDAREVGEIDWLHIEDRGRGVARIDECNNYQDAFNGLEGLIMLDPWKDQEVYVEVAVEKDALVGVVGRPASRWRAPYMACKGYLSASEAWRMGLRFQRAIAAGKTPILLHLGDHDPSGLHMTEDNRTRLSLFSRCGVEVRRLALNMDQVEEHSCPPNPAKMTDTRAAGYVAQYGESSWELDALPPKVLDDLIASNLEQLIDKDKWRASLDREAEMREPLSRFAHRWEELIDLVRMDEKPLERLKMLDSFMTDMPYHLGQAAHHWQQSLTAAIANSHGFDKDALSIIQRPSTAQEDKLLKDTGPTPDTYAGFKVGFDSGLEASATALAGVKPLTWNYDSSTWAAIQGLKRWKEKLEESKPTLFELPESYQAPKAEMPWDVLDEDQDLPDGYTDEEEPYEAD
jgi:hypothetical protein